MDPWYFFQQDISHFFPSWTNDRHISLLAVSVCVCFVLSLLLTILNFIVMSNYHCQCLVAPYNWTVYCTWWSGALKLNKNFQILFRFLKNWKVPPGPGYKKNVCFVFYYTMSIDMYSKLEDALTSYRIFFLLDQHLHSVKLPFQ